MMMPPISDRIKLINKTKKNKMMRVERLRESFKTSLKKLIAGSRIEAMIQLRIKGKT
jgi:hypothetical protein